MLRIIECLSQFWILPSRRQFHTLIPRRDFVLHQLGINISASVAAHKRKPLGKKDDLIGWFGVRATLPNEELMK
jgi:hypothetical protein